MPSDNPSGLDLFDAPQPEEPQEQRARRRRGMSTGSKVLIGVLALVLIVAGGGVGAYYWMKSTFQDNIESLGDPFVGLENRPEVTVPSTEELNDATATNFLVLGSDSRISAGDPTQWEYGAQRTDTIMLVHVPADQKNVFVMSIPRDSWVDVPGHGMAKINAAYSWGGPTLCIETVEQLTGVRIDHFAITDFESFKNITDVLGGVEISLKTDFTHDGVTVPAGSHRYLTGDQALRWVRERKSLPNGDFDRMQRQQAWVRAMVAKVRTSGTLNNPIETAKLTNAITKSIAADEGLDVDLLLSMSGLVKDLGSNDIVFFTMPNTGPGRSPDGKQSIIGVNQPELDSLMQAWREDDLGAYLAAHEGEISTLPAVTN